MEHLWEEAYRIACREERPKPDLSIPEEALTNLQHEDSPYLVLCDDDEIKGRGWYAAQDISAGTIVLVGKPLALVMEWEEYEHFGGEDKISEEERMEDDDDDYHPSSNDKEAPMNELLLVILLEKICQDPSLWTDRLSKLYPTNDSEEDPLPPSHGCANDALFLRAEELLNQIGNNTNLSVNIIKRRLPLIIRYNVLSVETASEQLSYPASPWTKLAGVGLFQNASLFNHDSVPNISRWCIGDVLFAVANQDIAKGTECCISYIEHDALCEAAWRRNALLQISRMDFMEEDADEEDEDLPGPEFPVVDSDVQNELMGMNPLERLGAIEELLQQALGEKVAEEEEEDMVGSAWYQCDVQNLRILKAITLEGIGKSPLDLWQTCLSFAQENLPHNDESVVVLAIQTAICAWLQKQEADARRYAELALSTHNTLFSFGRDEGLSWFRRRMKLDLELVFRSQTRQEEVTAAVDALWPNL